MKFSVKITNISFNGLYVFISNFQETLDLDKFDLGWIGHFTSRFGLVNGIELGSFDRVVIQKVETKWWFWFSVYMKD